MSITSPQHDPDYSDVIEQKIKNIEIQLNDIKDTLAFIEATIVKADTTITTVAAEVMPTINSLMESPMLKMFLPKGKK